MRRRTSWTILLCFVAQAGCDRAISAPEMPAAAQADLLDLGELPDIPELRVRYPDAKAIVVGKADLEAVIAPSVLSQQYQFYVVRHHDLSLQGRFKMHFSNAGGGVLDVVGDVSCLNFLGPVVELGGIVTRVNEAQNVTPVEPGTKVVWKVQDNGEGALAPPDLASAMPLASSAVPETFCSDENFALFPQDNGNIQVARR